MSDENGLVAKDLVKQFRGRRVVDGVSVHISRGEVVGLLGPNGAGKTTSFHLILGQIPPNEGTLLAFRCTPDAWHGHKSFEGRRRAIQLNWVVGDHYVKREQRRHRISAFFKRIKGG